MSSTHPCTPPKRGLWILIGVLFIVFCLHVTNALALEIKKHTTSNGLLVLHVERHSLPVVMATLLIKASPLDEKPDKAGVAYLTAKMLTEGTATRSAAELNEDIEFLGAGLQTSTNYDYTTVSLSVLKKDVDKGFSLFSDILLHPAFKEEELDRRKNLILGALRQQEEEPAFVSNKTFIKEVFGNYAYGRLVEGDATSVAGLKRDDVVHFYHTHYVPGNAILSVVGDMTPGELDVLIEKYLSSWQGKAEASIRKQNEEAIAETGGAGVKQVVINRDISQANIHLGHKGIARDNPDYYAVSVMNYILGGGGFASRLMRVIRDEMGLTYDIDSSFVSYKEPGPFDVSVQTKNESAATVIEETVKQIKKIQSGPVTDQELADAKAHLTGSFPLRLETSRRVADFLDAVEFYNLGDDYIRKYPDYINRVTKEDVLRVAQKYLNPENYVLIIVGDTKKMQLMPAKK